MHIVFVALLLFSNVLWSMDKVSSISADQSKKVEAVQITQLYAEAFQQTYLCMLPQCKMKDTTTILKHLQKFLDIPDLNKRFYQKIKERNDELTIFLLALGANPNGLMPTVSLSVSKKIILIPCWQKTIQESNLEQLKQLKLYGLNLNACNEQGLTLLMLTAIYNNAEITQYLLENGADPTAQSPEGKTACALAQRVNSQQVLHLLPPDKNKQPESADDDSDCCALQ